VHRKRGCVRGGTRQGIGGGGGGGDGGGTEGGGAIDAGGVIGTPGGGTTGGMGIFVSGWTHAERSKNRNSRAFSCGDSVVDWQALGNGLLGSESSLPFVLGSTDFT